MENIYEMVTNKIIEQLESGIIPWRKPWSGASNGAYNVVSKKTYSLLNQMLLKYAGPYATFKQWSDLGGKVKKGEKSETIVFWKVKIYEEEQEDGTKKEKIVPVLKKYSVFHISQVTGVEVEEMLVPKILEPCVEADKVINDYVVRSGITFKECITDSAFYSAILDCVEVPAKEQYSEIEEYYSTSFHELVHSTGHGSRLNRISLTEGASFGSEVYSKEELVAEIGSAMLMNRLQIDTKSTFMNSSGYIQSWLRKLKNDSKFVVSASSQAEKAVHYIYGDSENEE